MLKTKKRIFIGALLAVCVLFGTSMLSMANAQTDRHWKNLGNYDSTVNFAGAQGRAVFFFGGTTSGDTVSTSGKGKGAVSVYSRWTGFSGSPMAREQVGTGSASTYVKGKLWHSTHISYHRVTANGSYTSWENVRD